MTAPLRSRAAPEAAGAAVAGPSEVVLHVGMTKAGSTAIQNALDRHREALRGQGVLFPATGFTRTDPRDRTRSAGHVALLNQFRTGDAEAFEREWAEAGADRLVLSVENMLHDLSDQKLTPLADRLAGARVVVIAILRRQDTWLQSRYFESVVKGNRMETRSIDAFARALLAEGHFDYGAKLERMRHLFAATETRVLDYDRVTAAPDGLVGAFLQAAALDLALPADEVARRVNVSSVAPDAVEAMRRLNHLAAALSKTGRLIWSARMRGRVARAVARGGLSLGDVAPGHAQRESLLKAIGPVNRELSRAYFGGLPFGPTEAWLDAPARAADPGRVAPLVDTGLKILHEVAAGEAEGTGIARWTREELAVLRKAFRPGEVVLMNDRPEALAIAAARDEAVVFVACADADAARQRQMGFDRAEGSARVIALPGPVAAAPDIGGFRHPDLVFLDCAGQADSLRALAGRLARPVAVIVDVRGADDPEAIAAKAGLKRTRRSGSLLRGVLAPRRARARRRASPRRDEPSRAAKGRGLT